MKYEIHDLATGNIAELNALSGTLRPDALDISHLTRDLGVFTYDPGFMATASTESKITYIDGDAGVLLYRGYPVEQLAAQSSFLEVANLLIYGSLPTNAQLHAFQTSITRHTMINEHLVRLFRGFHHNAHPMAMVAAVAAFYHDTDGVRLMGFGHRVYKNFDPRAKIIRALCYRVLHKLGIRNDRVFELALTLEEIALNDDYFVSRQLYPNVDFYSGIIYSALGIPRSMFTVFFAIARTAGWVAHWQEMVSDPRMRIGRPRQLYAGPQRRDYTPIAGRLA